MCGTTVVIGGALALGLGAGLFAHEWAHARMARAFGVECTVEFFPNWDGSPRSALFDGPIARATPLPSAAVPAWQLRVAALAPLALVGPIAVAASTGSLSASELTPLTAFAIGWLACAIPSPQDFAVAFHVPALLESTTSAATSADDDELVSVGMDPDSRAEIAVATPYAGRDD